MQAAGSRGAYFEPSAVLTLLRVSGLAGMRNCLPPAELKSVPVECGAERGAVVRHRWWPCGSEAMHDRRGAHGACVCVDVSRGCGGAGGGGGEHELEAMIREADRSRR